MDYNILILLIISISAIVISVGCCILTGFSLYYSLKAYSTIMALEKSTHTITYAPVDKEIEEANKEWVTKQESLDKQNTLFKEDIEDNMPEFASNEDDNKIYSF